MIDSNTMCTESGHCVLETHYINEYKIHADGTNITYYDEWTNHLLTAGVDVAYYNGALIPNHRRFF